MDAEPLGLETAEPKTGQTFKIPKNPEDFDDNRVYLAVLQEVQAIRTNGHPNQTCRCSYYPLADTIAMALRGELFAGINNNSSSEVIARKITDLLFAEVVRIDSLKKTAGLKQAA